MLYNRDYTIEMCDIFVTSGFVGIWLYLNAHVGDKTISALIQSNSSWEHNACSALRNSAIEISSIIYFRVKGLFYVRFC